MENSEAKKFLIVGAGRSGLAAKKLLLQNGYDTKNILTFDEKDPSSDYSDIKQIEALVFSDIVVSPGFPLKKPFLMQLLNPKGGIQKPKLWSELSLAFDFLTTEKSIAITGSVGKSTTSFIIHKVFEMAGLKSFLGANFGTPLCEYISEVYFLKSKPKADWLVFELSSYQLENFQNFSCDYSVITTLNRNHLDRYDSVDHYYQTKLSLLLSTKRKSFLNFNGYDLLSTFNTAFKNGFQLPNSVAMLSKLHSLPVSYQWCKPDDFDRRPYQSNPFFKINHNLEIAALVLSLSQELGLESPARKALLDFKGLEHRFEMFIEKNGCLFINDSKATSIESVMSAIDSAIHLTDGKIAVLLGGKDKDLPWEKLSILKPNNQLRFLFFGEVAIKAKSLSGLDGTAFTDMNAAVGSLVDILKKGNSGLSIVLLSPGGTSLDQFKSFEERGQVFKNGILKHLQS